MMNIRQIGYNKLKLKKVSYPDNIDAEQDDQSQPKDSKTAGEDTDCDAIDVSKLNPMRSSRHVFVSHLIRIG